MPSSTEARTTDKLAEAHARFATAALFVYFGAALLALSLLLVAIVTDKTHNDEEAEEHLLLETQIRAHRLGDRLGVLVGELTRLSQRSEVNLLDQSLEPERELLELAHAGSSLFNLGVAVLSADGDVLWAEPETFLPVRQRFGTRPWFLDVRDRGASRIVQPNAKEPILYVVAPVPRDGRFTGALVGGVNLAKEPALTGPKDRPYLTTCLATRRGTIIYPPAPPSFARSAEWFSIFQGPVGEPITAEVLSDGGPAVAAVAQVPGADLYYAMVASETSLFKDGDQRLWGRLLAGIFLALAPMLALVVLLQRSLAKFRRSETEAVREEHLRSIGEAANVIAHEVRNSLNGIRMGIDLMLDRQRTPSDRVVVELRAEIERLVSFTHQLMLFAKNPDPERTPVDLSEALPKWISLTRDVAQESGVEIELSVPAGPVVVPGDPVLLQIVVGNLVSNALDAVASANPPRIAVTLSRKDTRAEIRVVDNGPGVPEALAGRLFEPFVTGKPSGVGMGLSISRKIALAHGGNLELVRGGAGTEFLLTLPF